MKELIEYLERKIELCTEMNMPLEKFAYTDALKKARAVFSQDYLDWVKQANLPPLTNTQHKFAEWLLLEENAKVISQIGDLDTIFSSVRRWLKNGR